MSTARRTRLLDNHSPTGVGVPTSSSISSPPSRSALSSTKIASDGNFPRTTVGAAPKKLRHSMYATDGTELPVKRHFAKRSIEPALAAAVDADPTKVRRALERAHAAVEAELERVTSQLGTTRSELGATKSQLGAARSELGAAKSDLNDANSELGGAKSELGDAKSELGAVKSELEAAKSDAAAERKRAGEERARADSLVAAAASTASEPPPSEPPSRAVAIDESRAELEAARAAAGRYREQAELERARADGALGVSVAVERAIGRSTSSVALGVLSGALLLLSVGLLSASAIGGCRSLAAALPSDASAGELPGLCSLWGWLDSHCAAEAVAPSAEAPKVVWPGELRDVCTHWGWLEYLQPNGN